MPHATRASRFDRADLTTFCRLDELGLEATGQRLEPDRAVVACRVTNPDRWCRRCGCEGVPRDSVTRHLAHEPLGWRPTMLEVTIRRYRCTECGHVWRQDTTLMAEPRAKLSRQGLRWALEAIVCQHLTVARVAEGLGVAWNTANTAILAEGHRMLISDPTRFDGVSVLGVDEHVWRQTRRHAHAQHVTIQVSTGNEIHVRVVDDGERTAPHEPGFGLRQLRARVEAAGGTFRAASGEVGFEVSARYPAPEAR